MNHTPAIINDKIEQLLLHKSFDQLTQAERQLLHGQLTSEQYTRMRDTLLAAKHLLQSDVPTPNPAVRRQLQQHLAAQRTTARPFQWLADALTYRLPAWQVAMGFATMVLYFLFPWTKPAPPIVHEPAVIYKTDTVYQDRPVYVEASMAKPGVSVQKTLNNQKTSKSVIEVNVAQLSTKPNTILDTIQQVVEDFKSVLPDTPSMPIWGQTTPDNHKVLAMDTSAILKEVVRQTPAAISKGRTLNKDRKMMEFFTDVW